MMVSQMVRMMMLLAAKMVERKDTLVIQPLCRKNSCLVSSQ